MDILKAIKDNKHLGLIEVRTFEGFTEGFCKYKKDALVSLDDTEYFFNTKISYYIIENNKLIVFLAKE